MPLMFQWFYKSEPYGLIQKLNLQEGDVCFFSRKSTGFDFGKPSLLTLRHAAGADTCSYSKPKLTKQEKAVKKRDRVPQEGGIRKFGRVKNGMRQDESSYMFV